MSKWDRRLLGTWKSDRRRTFRNHKPHPGFRPKLYRKFRRMFGKLIVRWGRGKCYWKLGGPEQSETYEVIAMDATSAVIRYTEPGSERLVQIHFDSNFYWIALGSGLCEYFKRVE